MDSKEFGQFPKKTALHKAMLVPVRKNIYDFLASVYVQGSFSWGGFPLQELSGHVLNDVNSIEPC